MQPIKRLTLALDGLADSNQALFSLNDLRCIIPEISQGAFRALVARCVKNQVLKRVCHGIYLYPVRGYQSGLVLHHAAAKLRADGFCYLSLESVLSDAGVISQMPINWITLMSSGRSYTISCGEFGHIEYIHTKKAPADLGDQLRYDARCRLWRASIQLALKDMRATGRSVDLIDQEALNDAI